MLCNCGLSMVQPRHPRSYPCQPVSFEGFHARMIEMTTNCLLPVIRLSSTQKLQIRRLSTLLHQKICQRIPLRVQNQHAPRICRVLLHPQQLGQRKTLPRFVHH
ncbi:MAG TPA: hypothetical protein DIT89_02405 [Planctomycetaceae bacterium]|nr:hypothetical protein [Planctomycetaceae bacterium]